MLEFPLSQALFGRRSRRFALGSALPEGPLAFTSRHEPLPLTDLEQMVLLTATAGVTGWHYLLKRHDRYGPALPNYSAGAGGRTFPSAAGWQTSELFYTDDNGIYLFATRDAPALVEPDAEGKLDIEALLEAHRGRIRKLSEGRLSLPVTEAHIDGHNLWCANQPGSTLLFPVADLAQHFIAILCYLVQNGSCLYDNVHGERIAGLERFRHLVDLDNPAPLTELEQAVLTMATAELATCCYAGMLMLQAMGLGGWMYTGLNWLSVLGASGEANVPGLGFRYDSHPAWAIPNPTGRSGVFEGYCPPHYPDMRAAVEAFAERKFGQGGPFHPETPGPWKETTVVRSSAQPYSEEFKDCVAVMAQYIYDRFGKFPGTIPTIFTETFLQAHHLDLEFYDHHFGPGAYLWTHAQHMADWHPESPE
jgi:hypothetical protein